MAITASTLSGAITAYATQFALSSTTGVTAPVLTTGSGATYLYCEAEMMAVTAVPVSGTVQVVRGVLGTMAVAHVTSSGVLAGLVTDFPNFVAKISTESPLLPDRFSGVSAIVASAATVVAPGPLFHVSGGTAINIITPPANFVEGQVTIIFDSACTWTSSNVTYGISASGSSTTAASAVTFLYDAATLRWYPSRLA